MICNRGNSSRRHGRGGPAAAGRVLALLLILLAGCNVGFNPSFLANLGVSPITALGDQPGSILLVLINRTAFPAELRVRLFEAEGFQPVVRLAAAANSFFTVAADCDISQITFETLVVTAVDANGATSAVDVVVDTADLVAGSNFTCGRVIVATVSGTTQNFAMTTRVQ